MFKEVFERERPCHILEGVRVVDRCEGPYGFVSSHDQIVLQLLFLHPYSLETIKYFSGHLIERHCWS